ncbi:MAG: hypothetical protein JSU73_04720, partial [candidate division WOR-3 bacterium]
MRLRSRQKQAEKAAAEPAPSPRPEEIATAADGLAMTRAWGLPQSREVKAAAVLPQSKEVNT